MNRALELFRETPLSVNCAQAVASGCGRPDLKDELSGCGGGRAPEGRCGALYAALLLSPAERHEELRRRFAAGIGSEFCREIKTVHHVPCERCVEFAASLVGDACK